MSGKKRKMPQYKIVQLVSTLSGLSRRECKTVINDYITVVRECMMNGFEVVLPEIGIIGSKYHKAKPERYMPNVNHNGEMRLVEAKKEYDSPSFRFSKPFVEEMREATYGNPFHTRKSIYDNLCDCDEEDEMEIEETFDYDEGGVEINE